MLGVPSILLGGCFAACPALPDQKQVTWASGGVTWTLCFASSSVLRRNRFFPRSFWPAVQCCESGSPPRPKRASHTAIQVSGTPNTCRLTSPSELRSSTLRNKRKGNDHAWEIHIGHDECPWGDAQRHRPSIAVDVHVEAAPRTERLVAGA